MIRKVVNWFANLLRNEVRYKTVLCDELPDNLEKRSLYLVGEDNTYWLAALICPCGCGDIIQLTLDIAGRPRWQANINKKLEVTLKPSIHRRVHCRSHFFIKKGNLIWCE